MLSNFDVKNKEKRDAYDKVLDFINSDRCFDGTIGVIYGLRRTGKTTIMEQIMTDYADRLSFEFWQVEPNDTMNDVYACLDKAVESKTDCVFIDEITNAVDFIDESAMLADYYAKEGIRIRAYRNGKTVCYG